MKECIKLFKLYRKKPTKYNLFNFFGSAIHEYTKMITGHDLCLSHIGINNLKDFDNWIKNDLKFKEWFKKEFDIWIKYEGNNLIMIDLREKDLKLYRNQKLEPKRKFAEPRDVYELTPE